MCYTQTVRVHPWKLKFAVPEPPQGTTTPVWQYTCHLIRCLTDAFQGFKSLCSGKVDPSLTFKAAVLAKGVESAGSFIPLASIFTSAAAAGVKLCDKRMEQWKAVGFTKAMAAPSDFEAAVTLAAYRMASIKHEVIQALRTQEAADPVPEATLEESLESFVNATMASGVQSAVNGVLFVPSLDNTEARREARKDANLALAPLLLAQHEDLSLDTLARVLYGAMGGWMLEQVRVASPESPWPPMATVLPLSSHGLYQECCDTGSGLHHRQQQARLLLRHHQLQLRFHCQGPLIGITGGGPCQGSYTVSLQDQADTVIKAAAYLRLVQCCLQSRRGEGLGEGEAEESANLVVLYDLLEAKAATLGLNQLTREHSQQWNDANALQSATDAAESRAPASPFQAAPCPPPSVASPCTHSPLSLSLKAEEEAYRALARVVDSAGSHSLLRCRSATEGLVWLCSSCAVGGDARSD